jgi:hypothetical protein
MIAQQPANALNRLSGPTRMLRSATHGCSCLAAYEIRLNYSSPTSPVATLDASATPIWPVWIC